MSESVVVTEQTRGLRKGLILLFAVACGLSAANLYYAQTVLGSIAKSFHSGSATVGLTVTLAQVFWMKNGDTGGQPDRYYVTADSDMSVSGDFADFGGDMNGLRKRLKARDGVRVHDAFPEYGKDFRRRLGIESEQAMELFHQTVSMKSVGT